MDRSPSDQSEHLFPGICVINYSYGRQKDHQHRSTNIVAAFFPAPEKYKESVCMLVVFLPAAKSSSCRALEETSEESAMNHQTQGTTPPKKKKWLCWVFVFTSNDFRARPRDFPGRLFRYWMRKGTTNVIKDLLLLLLLWLLLLLLLFLFLFLFLFLLLLLLLLFSGVPIPNRQQHEDLLQWSLHLYQSIATWIDGSQLVIPPPEN